MNMTIAPALGDLDRERLRKARRINGDPVLLALVSAAIHIDDGQFADAQIRLLDAVNGHTAGGSRIPVEAHALVDIVRKGLQGHRYQICALRSCLDTVDAVHLGCSAISMGERAGRVIQAMSQLMAAQRLRAAA